MKKIPTQVATDLANLRLADTFVSPATVEGKATVRVTKDPKVTAVDEATFARIVDADFKNGIIEVTVLSKLLADAPDFARGFIGVAFRIDERNTQFECMYIRPTNGRAAEQLRRNRATQYFSYPASSLIASGKQPLANLNHTPTWGSTNGSRSRSRSGMSARSSI